MATRTISTKLVLDGEAQYRQSIKDINSELSVLKSALDLVKAKYADQANGMEALSAKGKALNDVYSKQEEKVRHLKEILTQAQAAQQKYKDHLDAATEGLASLNQESEDYETQQAALIAQQAEAQKGYHAATRSVNDWQKQVNHAEIELAKLSSEIKANDQYMDEAGRSADGCATSIDKFGKSSKKAGESTDGASASIDALAAALIASGLKRGFEEIVEVLNSCVSASIEFESAITSVYKTVNGSDEQLAAISNGIKELALSIPATTTELAAVAEAAGQLGIATNDILSFTEVMTNLGVATDLTSDQAATLLAQFANITGMDAANFERLGSTIVALGNNFATTESKITNMAQGMASSASMAGMSEPEILALSTALSSLGTESEAGSSAMSKLIKQMQTAVETGEGLDSFASAAGVSATEFKAAWGESAVGALNMFIQGLNDTGRNGASAIVVLENMGLTETRLSNAVLKLASSKTVLTDALETADAAWKQNNALQEEAEKRYKTTESRMILLENATNSLKIAVGDALTPALNRLADAGTAAMQWAADFVEKNPGIVSLIGAAAAALGVLTVAVAGYTLAVKIAIPAIQAFNAALKDNPFGLAATALAVLVTGITALVLLLPDATSETDKLHKSVNETADAYDELNAKLDEERTSTSTLMAQIAQLSSVENKSAAEKAKLAELVDQLNQTVPDLALAYDSETDALNMGTDAIRERIKAQQDAAEYEAQVKRLIELEIEQSELQEQLAEQQELLAERGEGRYFSSGAWEDYGHTGNIEKLTEAIAANQAQQDGLTASVNAYSAARAEAAAQEAALLEPYEASKLAVQGLQEEMTALETKYREAYQTAYDSISQQMGLWEDMGEIGKTSADTLNSALESQIKYLDEYSRNMGSLLGRNIEGIEDFALLFSDGSKESAEALAGLSTASDEEILEIIQNLKKVEEGKKEFSDQFAEMSTNFKASFDEMSDRLTSAVIDMNHKAEAAEAGVQTVQGYIDGAKSMENALLAQFKRLAEVAQKGYNSTLAIESPSRVMAESGRNTVEGLIVGVEATGPDLALAMRQAAETARTAADKAIPRGYENITGGSNVVNNHSTSTSQIVNIYSGVPLTPSEIGRETKNALRRMAW